MKKNILKALIFTLLVAAFVLPLEMIDSPALSNGVAYAEWSEKRLTVDAAYSYWPSVAADASGNIHVVWYDGRDGNSEIYYKKFNKQTNTWEADTRLTNALSESNRPIIAADPSGNLHVVWYDYRDGNYEIYYKKFNKQTNAWETDTRLTNAPTDSYLPSIAADPSGNIHVVWSDYRNGFGEVYYKQFSGASWSADTRLTYGPGTSYSTSIAADPSGNLHVVWRNDRDAGLWKIYYKNFNGTSWSADTLLTGFSVNCEPPSIAADPSGNIHVTWHDNRDGIYKIYYKKKLNGVWTVDTKLTDNAPHDFTPLYSPVAVDPSGNVHVTWCDRRDGNHEIYYKKFNEQTYAWETDKRLTNNASDSYLASIAADPSGNVHVVWSDYRDGNYEIYYASAGEMTSPAISVNSTNFSFSAQAGGINPEKQALQISNTGGTLNWTVSKSVSWLKLNGSDDNLVNGTALGTVEIQANISGLTAGTYSAIITVEAAGASNSPMNVSVVLTVTPSPTRSISGQVTGISGRAVKVFLSGDITTYEAVSANGGTYTFAGLTSGAAYTVTIEAVTGYGVSPEAGYAEVINSDLTGRNFRYSKSPKIAGLPPAGEARNHPNPFNPLKGQTIIIFNANALEVKVMILDQRGKTVAAKAATPSSGNYYEVPWDGRSDSGEVVGNGTYIYLILDKGKVVAKGQMAVWK